MGSPVERATSDKEGVVKSRQLLAIVMTSFVCTSATSAKPKHAVQRGAIFSVQMQLVANAPVQAASLTWQAFERVDPKTGRIYEQVSPEQKGMATAFLCDADVVANNSSLAMSCKVPLDVADGTYYLTAISIRTRDTERKYSWLGDLPADVEVQIRGGDEVRVPHIKSILIKE